VEVVVNFKKTRLEEALTDMLICKQNIYFAMSLQDWVTVKELVDEVIIKEKYFYELRHLRGNS